MEPALIRDYPIEGISHLEIFPPLAFGGQIHYPLFIDGQTYITGKIEGSWIAEELPEQVCSYVGNLIEYYKL